jgi:hypothetical protein
MEQRETLAKARGLCSVPACERPSADETFGCVEHMRLFNAQSAREAWNLALEIVRPMVDMTHKIGSDELSSVLEKAEAEAQGEHSRALDEIEAAEAALAKLE